MGNNWKWFNKTLIKEVVKMIKPPFELNISDFSDDPVDFEHIIALMNEKMTPDEIFNDSDDKHLLWLWYFNRLFPVMLTD